MVDAATLERWNRALGRAARAAEKVGDGGELRRMIEALEDEVLAAYVDAVAGALERDTERPTGEEPRPPELQQR